jgi:hypothetical protein
VKYLRGDKPTAASAVKKMNQALLHPAARRKIVSGHQAKKSEKLAV